jgi:hypothetical protein
MVWLRGLDSNQDNQIQSLVCCRLHYPGAGQKSLAEALASAQCLATDLIRLICAPKLE